MLGYSWTQIQHQGGECKPATTREKRADWKHQVGEQETWTNIAIFPRSILVRITIITEKAF